MDYQILPPTVFLSDRDLWLLNTELNNFTLEQLKRIVIDFERVFRGEYEASSFGLEAIIVSFDKDKATIEHYGELIKEVSSSDIYSMLKDYYTKLYAWNQALLAC